MQGTIVQEMVSQLFLTPLPLNLLVVSNYMALEKVRSFLSLVSTEQVDEISIFKKRESLDPVIAIRIGGVWYSIFEWE